MNNKNLKFIEISLTFKIITWNADYGTNNISLCALMFSYEIINAATIQIKISSFINKFCCRRLVIIHVHKKQNVFHPLSVIVCWKSCCCHFMDPVHISHFLPFSFRNSFYFSFVSLLLVNPFFLSYVIS